MGQIWSQENKFQKMLEVEIAVARVQAKNKIIPEKAARDIARLGKFKVSRIEEIEKTTNHDVIAFVSNVAENVGVNGKFVHYALTSSDVLDTALSLQLREAGNILVDGIVNLEKALNIQIQRHAATLCIGRTHGIHAEMTSFGVKLSGFAAELSRNKSRLKNALTQMQVGKFSGAVGTYTNLSQKIEKEICEKLGLKPEVIATQVIPRDRLAEVFSSIALLAGFIERLATELRHLQRTEVSEVSEHFALGQKGSSAMPHKKNPISAENLTGLARLMRSNLFSALENIVLWHERDISHSSVERVIIPDTFIICDYALNRLTQLISKIQVDKNQMQKNIDLLQGQIFSSQVLLNLVQSGLTREEAYQIVQSSCHDLKKGEHLLGRLIKNIDNINLTAVSDSKNRPNIKINLKKSDLEKIFRASDQKARMKSIVQRLKVLAK
jgi:adenylosuccinate lyase